MKIHARSGKPFRHHQAIVDAMLSQLPASKEFIRYPSDLSGIEAAIKQRKLTRHYSADVASVIDDQYRNFNTAEAVTANIRALSENRALTVTCGHQLCLMGGPAYFFYKILSTIKLAQYIREKIPGETIIPIFWLASEDHDKEEINHLILQGNRHIWTTNQQGPVGRFTTEGLRDFIEQNPLFSGNNANVDLKSIFLKAAEKTTLTDFTRYWVNALFGSTGLIILDADDVRLKKLFVPIMLDDLLAQHTFKKVSDTNSKLHVAGFHVQVNPREVNVFYMNNGQRTRIERNGENWSTVDGSAHWNVHQLTGEVETHPDRFSPNVLLRPLYQECLLPNVAFVGGPAEIAYWMQLRSTFEHHGLHYPCLVLRDSALILAPATVRKMAKLQLAIDDLFEAKANLLNRISGWNDEFLRTDLNRLEDLYNDVAEKIAAVDPTLRSAALSEHKRAQHALQQVITKVKRAAKQKEEIKVRQLEEISSDVFPSGEPQERSESFLSFLILNPTLQEELLKAFNPLQNQLSIAEL